MKNLATLFAHKITKDRDLLNPAERRRIGLIESWVSIAGNLFLSLLKITFGLLTNSIALIADAVHSASDIFSSLVVLIGFTLAGKKPDHEHPYGHGRVEYLAGLLIAVLLIGAGAAFVYSSYTRLIGEVHIRPSAAALVALTIAILMKEFMYFFSANLGNQIRSDALAGDAWHHRSDSLSSLLVLAALVGAYLGMPFLDAYLGFGVALFIIYAGIRIARNSCSLLLGIAPAEDLKEEVIKCAKEVDGVIDAHDLKIHDYGAWKIITLHIAVDRQLHLDEAHEIAHMVEEKINECFYCDTVVHLDPQ
jgi:cation diffusion facilitator family transporter